MKSVLGRNALLPIKSTECVSVSHSSAQKGLRTDMRHFKFCPRVPTGVQCGEAHGKTGSVDMAIIPMVGRASKASL